MIHIVAEVNVVAEVVAEVMATTFCGQTTIYSGCCIICDINNTCLFL